MKLNFSIALISLFFASAVFAALPHSGDKTYFYDLVENFGGEENGGVDRAHQFILSNQPELAAEFEHLFRLESHPPTTIQIPQRFDLNSPAIRTILNTPEGVRQFRQYLETLQPDQRARVTEQLGSLGISLPEKTRKKADSAHGAPTKTSQLKAAAIIFSILVVFVLLFLAIYFIRRRSSQVILSSATDRHNVMV
jgi:hypothetical protein